MATQRRFKCYACNYEWEVPHGSGKPGRQMICPKCGSSNIHRLDPGGFGKGRGRGSEGEKRP